jgi:hypothetical protein
MPSTAQALGTTVEAIRGMNALEQLELVASYFEPFKGRLRSLADCYMAILWPAAVGKPDGEVIFPPGSQAMLMNRGLDIDHDGAVTKAEATSFVANRLQEGLAAGVACEVGTLSPTTEAKSMPIAAILAAFGPILAQLVPQVAKVLNPKPTDVAGRNMDLIKLVLDTIVSASGQPNVQAAVEAMQGDRDVQKTVQEAVVREPQIMAMLEIGAGDFKSAREANVALVAAATKWWQLLLNPVLLVTIFVLPLVYMFVYGMTFGRADVGLLAKVSPDVIAQTMGTVIGLVLGGIMGFWMGQTFQQTNRRATDQNLMVKEEAKP